MNNGACIVRIPAPSGYARQAVDMALGTVPLVVLSHRMVAQLERECGTSEKLARWLLKLVGRRRRPLGLHNPATDQTLFYAPADWSQERLQGYLAVYHEELEAQFGPIERMRAAKDGRYADRV
jgi:hypothetical protein